MMINYIIIPSQNHTFWLRSFKLYNLIACLSRVFIINSDFIFLQLVILETVISN